MYDNVTCIGLFTLAPIWLPHWPAWIWTISLILNASSRNPRQEWACLLFTMEGKVEQLQSRSVALQTQLTTTYSQWEPVPPCSLANQEDSDKRSSGWTNSKHRNKVWLNFPGIRCAGAVFVRYYRWEIKRQQQELGRPGLGTRRGWVRRMRPGDWTRAGWSGELETSTHLVSWNAPLGWLQYVYLSTRHSM